MEPLEGVRIIGRRSGWTRPPALEVGEEVRFTERGPWCRVVAVTDAAACVRGFTLDGGPAPEPEPVVIPERIKVTRGVAGTKTKVLPAHTFTPTTSGRVERVSRYSHVLERRVPA